MKPTARHVARRVLARVAEGAYATLSLSGELERAGLSPEDRGLCTELVYGVLRKRLLLDHALSAYAPKGLGRVDQRTLDALRLGAYQLLFLRTPAHAAVDDAVTAVSKLRGSGLGGFANALLRRLSRSGQPALPADPVEALSIGTSTPRWLVEDALRGLGPEEGRLFLEAQAGPAPVWLRLNPLRGPLSAALAALAREVAPEHLRQSDRLPEAVRVAGAGGAIFHGPAYGEGWFTAQDLGAQLVTRLLFGGGPLPAGPILDACAGVGGKSTHLCALTGEPVILGREAPQPRRQIDAADQSERKLDLLRDHAHRLGCTVRPICCDLTDPAAPLQRAYAAVLLDAPCSGLGVLRRHPEARWRLTPDKIAELSALQRLLLDRLAQRVMPGGLLVYSVCTYTDEEGPGQIAAFLASHPEFQPDHPEALRTWPHRDDADAFYAIRLRRRS